MHRMRGQMHDFFDFKDPFSDMGLFGRPSSLISSFFGGSDPFDDPFFTSPFETLMSPSMFTPMNPSLRSPFVGASNTRYIEQGDPNPVRKSKGPIIKELSSDEEGEEKEKVEGETKNRGAKYLKNLKSLVEEPDEETEVERKKRAKNGNELSSVGTDQNRPFSYTFQSSTVTYGGNNGAYYTTSMTRRTDELAGFEEQWNKNGRKHLPVKLAGLDNGKMGYYQRVKPKRGCASSIY
ncbi:hypothetical protein LUZ61_019718 [Rhynchospora tenuis]|uniref:Uncharacterized protein n=1 Tax=Rhynchospora tenuis TaxID=198213 RepID=A0AAD5ZBZ0_9POAL|nr:hypothetical protein LUZ61_019718 [Rhynchospora tenuis]